MQSSRTVTLALMLFELLPLELCQSQNCVFIVSALLLENCSSYFHVTFYKYQSTLDDLQSSKTITLTPEVLWLGLECHIGERLRYVSLTKVQKVNSKYYREQVLKPFLDNDVPRLFPDGPESMVFHQDSGLVTLQEFSFSKTIT